MYTAVPCSRIFSLDSDHLPFLSQPNELAARLAETAKLIDWQTRKTRERAAVESEAPLRLSISTGLLSDVRGVVHTCYEPEVVYAYKQRRICTSAA